MSANGGIHQAVENASHVGVQGTFAFFLSSPRSWKGSELGEIAVNKFTELLKTHGIKAENLLPHGNYLINLASSDNDVLLKSRTLIASELEKCKKLNIKYYNVHPGSAGKTGNKTEALKILVESINLTHTVVPDVTIVIENMAGQGNVLCSDLSDFKVIVDGVKDKSRIGFCLDTCHLFAAGYDVSKDIKGTLAIFDEQVGRSYLKAFHLNDSMYDLGMKKDRHAKLGCGKIGWKMFHTLMQDSSLDDVIFITETPGDDESRVYELGVLKSLSTS